MFLKYITSKLFSILVYFVSAPSYISFLIYGNRNSWRIFTHTTSHERLLLYRLALQQPKGAIFVEVGSYLGASTCFLAAGAKKNSDDTRVHCIDTWQNDAMSEGVRDTWDEFQKNTQPFEEFIIPHRGISKDIGDTFDQKIDLLFIDGDHSYEGCREDVMTWLPHLKSGGIIIMHDYGWAKGVRRVVAEMIQPQQIGKGHVLQNIYWTRIR